MTLVSLPVAALLHFLLLMPADQPHAQVQEVKQAALLAPPCLWKLLQQGSSDTWHHVAALLIRLADVQGLELFVRPIRQPMWEGCCSQHIIFCNAVHAAVGKSLARMLSAGSIGSTAPAGVAV